MKDLAEKTTYYEIRAKAPDGPVCIVPGNMSWGEVHAIMGFRAWVVTPIEKELAR